MADVRVVQSSAIDRWDIKNVLAPRWMRPASQLMRIGSVAQRRIEPNKGDARYGSVHFDGSISLRPSTTVMKGATFLAYPSDVVFSRIDVRNGAIGVVAEQSSVLAFSNEYPIYSFAEHGRLLPEYVRLLCRTAVFRSQIQALVVGHSGRKRVSADQFEDMLIPVPDIAEQHEIVVAHRQRLDQVAGMRAKSRAILDDAVKEITALLGIRSLDVAPVKGAFLVPSHLPQQWSVFSAASAVRGVRNEVESSFTVLPLGADGLAQISYGVSKSPKNRPGQHGRPYLRVANVQDGYLNLSHMKYIDVPEPQMDQFRLEIGDVLLCEGNSAALVGRPALWNGEIEDCVHQNHVLRVRCNPLKLVPEYLLAYMQTAPSRGHFRRRAKQTTNLATINSTDVRELLVPIPPIDVQEAVAAIWREARQAATDLHAQARSETRQAFAETESRIVGK